MTTLRQIVIDAFREGGLVQVGLTPDADEFDEGLRKVKTIINSLYGNEMGVPFTPVSYGTEGIENASGKNADSSAEILRYFAPSNIRLLVNSGEEVTIYLDPNPDDGARFAVTDVAGTFGTNNFIINGNGRRIEDALDLTLSTDRVKKSWFFRQDLGDWVAVTDLTADSDSPFPEEYDDLLILMAAKRLSPRYQTQLSSESVDELRRLRGSFRARYKQSVPMGVEQGLLRLPSSYAGDGSYEQWTSGWANLDSGVIFEGGGA